MYYYFYFWIRDPLKQMAGILNYIFTGAPVAYNPRTCNLHIFLPAALNNLIFLGTAGNLMISVSSTYAYALFNSNILNKIIGKPFTNNGIILWQRSILIS